MMSLALGISVLLVVIFLVVVWRVERSCQVKPVYDEQNPHPKFVEDPEHYDVQGRYLWWGH